MSSVNSIRAHFLSYFEKDGHVVLPSSPLTPENDPTLMFTNSGMVPFKNIFTGMESPAQSRAVTAQKCLRAGGKHNDLDNVGYTARHHTFFEMLGNFSFGDYFKEHAIERAWTLLTNEFAIHPDKLLVTIYHNDDEAYTHWKKITGFDDRKIIRIHSHDNFWRMGDVGPCGPCSEIFYDHGDHIEGGPPGSANEDGDRFVEIWNLVFMQYEEKHDKSQTALPHPSIDTGMGIERIAAVLQGTHDNYHIDLFQNLIRESQNLIGRHPQEHDIVSHRIIADHLRASSFLISEGVLPSADGRGYVLRRIMRRAMRHAYLLGAKDPLLCRMVPRLITEMGNAYTALSQQQTLITETLYNEEIRFGKTLEKGLTILDDASHTLTKGEPFPGDVAFKLYDTYGFPLDLTQEALRNRNIHVDQEAFDREMQNQKERARKNWIGSGDNATQTIWFEIAKKIPKTEFLGYEKNTTHATILAIISNDTFVDTLPEGLEGGILTNQTVFYAESGGQIGDTGTIICNDNSVFNVTHTVKILNEYHVHFGQCVKGSLSNNDPAFLSIHTDKRQDIRCNHSATHLLHAALRKVLGEHVIQKGSSVTPHRLRFDFSHNHSLTSQNITDVENSVNHTIRENSAVKTRVMNIDDAKASGAMALFGEKYAHDVRVVTMGKDTHKAPSSNDKHSSTKKPCTEHTSLFSMELCGGTHVNYTGDIGYVKIISESSVSSGIRRIEAVSANMALQWIHNLNNTMQTAQQLLRTTPHEFISKLQHIIDEKHSADNTIQTLKRRLALEGISRSDAQSSEEKIGAMVFIYHHVKNMSIADIRMLIDTIKQKHSACVAVIISESEDNKIHIVIGVSETLTHRIDAVECVRQASKTLGGKGGGGRKDMAQAGGSDISKIKDAIHSVRTKCQELFANT